MHITLDAHMSTHQGTLTVRGHGTMSAEYVWNEGFARRSHTGEGDTLDDVLAQIDRALAVDEIEMLLRPVHQGPVFKGVDVATQAAKMRAHEREVEARHTAWALGDAIERYHAQNERQRAAYDEQYGPR
jgi:hypothetical protein